MKELLEGKISLLVFKTPTSIDDIEHKLWLLEDFVHDIDSFNEDNVDQDHVNYHAKEGDSNLEVGACKLSN